MKKKRSKRPRKDVDYMEYLVSYYLGNMYHSYLVDADNEAEAFLKVLNGLNENGKKILHNLKVERHYRKW